MNNYKNKQVEFRIKLIYLCIINKTKFYILIKKLKLIIINIYKK